MENTVKAYCATCARLAAGTCTGEGPESVYTGCAMREPVTLTPDQLRQLAREYREFKRIKEEAESELERIQAAFIAAMEAAGTDEIKGDDFKASYKPVNRSKFDMDAAEAAFPGLKALYSIPAPYNRFILK